MKGKSGFPQQQRLVMVSFRVRQETAERWRSFIRRTKRTAQQAGEEALLLYMDACGFASEQDVCNEPSASGLPEGETRNSGPEVQPDEIF